MTIKSKHKEYKTKVNEVEEQRNNDRGIHSWYDLRELKKIKLKLKDQLKLTKKN